MRLLLASRETHGNQGRADVLSSNVHFHLPLFFDTLKKKQKKKKYLSFASLTGASHTDLIPPSQCQNSAKVNGGELVGGGSNKERERGERGQPKSGMEVRILCSLKMGEV